MEKAVGRQLTKKWDEMDEEGHVQLVKNLCRLDGELAAITFPAYGSLYLREFMDDDMYEPLAPELDPFGRFCIGPSCRRDETESVQAQARFNQGPCKCAFQMAGFPCLIEPHWLADNATNATYYFSRLTTICQGSLCKN